MSRGKAGAAWLVFVVLLAAAAAFAWTHYLRIPANVAYVSEESGAISVIDLKSLRVIRKIHPPNISPRGLALSPDGKYLVVANKDTSDVAVFSTPRLRLVRRIHVGEN